MPMPDMSKASPRKVKRHQSTVKSRRFASLAKQPKCLRNFQQKDEFSRITNKSPFLQFGFRKNQQMKHYLLLPKTSKLIMTPIIPILLSTWIFPKYLTLSHENLLKNLNKKNFEDKAISIISIYLDGRTKKAVLPSQTSIYIQF